MVLCLRQKVVAATAGVGAAVGYDVVMSGHSRFDQMRRVVFLRYYSRLISLLLLLC